ncbi:MAG: hypothetical protein K8H88_14265 [Sandaracinaceae bacterium]|nr:hypothetical protein [Sandaracinaceae bacterium]
MRKSLLFVGLVMAIGCDSTPAPTDGGNTMVDGGNAMVDGGNTMVDGGPVTPDCATYCTAIMANCTGAVAQYSSMGDCMSACGALAVGTAADMAGNTVGCRTYHAGAAAAMPDVHCVHAGPGGASACGSNCEGFCAIALHACTGANMQYADVGACMTECAGFPDTETYDTSDTGGDTLACRLYHLTVATNSPDVHCPHIVEASPVCN